MVRFIKSFIILFAFAWLSAYAQQITVKASTDTTKYKVGDYINYKLKFSYDKGIRVNYPSLKDTIKNLDFIREEPPVSHESNGKVFETHNYIFSKYDSSIVKIPSYKIGYTSPGGQGVLTVDPMTITVSTIPVDTTKDIQDVKPPVEIPFNWALAVIILAVLILLAIAGYLIYRHYKKKHQPEEKIIIIPPYELALKELSELDAKQLWQQGKIKEYHSEITGIIRKYFEGRFGFMALEMTTSEVLKSLETSGGSAVKELTEKFLNNADLVKFAKFVPMPSVNTEMMEQALSIVNNTKPENQVQQKNEGENV